MTVLWAIVPAVFVIGLAVTGLLLRRLDRSVTDLRLHLHGFEQARLATIVVEDELAALRAALAERPRQ